jgi:hypothetical protein
MRLQLTRIVGVLALAAAAAMLVAAMGTSAAGASEFKSAGGFPVTFLGEGVGRSTFLSENLNLVTCENSHAKGSVENSKLATTTITYLTKCELHSVSPTQFNEACPTITTNKLDVVPLSKLNGGALTGVLVLPFTGSELASFTCTGSNKVNVKVKGSVICESTPIGPPEVTKGEVICRPGTVHGTQQFSSGTAPAGNTVSSGLIAESTLSIFKITEKDSQTTTEQLTYSKAIEQTS